MSKSEISRSFVYREKHNVILATIAEIMEQVEHKQVNKEGFKPGKEGGAFNEKTKEESKCSINVFPTVKQICKKTGFSSAIVKKHLSDLNFENFKGTAQALTPLVIQALTRKAISTGNKAEVELFLQVVEGWIPETKVQADHSGALEISVKRRIKTSSK